MKSKLLFALVGSVLFSSCNLPLPVPLPPGQLGETPTLSGKAQNWVGRALSLKLEVQKGRGATATLEYLGGGTIDATGNFSMVLPGKSIMTPYLEPAKASYSSATCPTIKIAPNDVRNSSAVNLVVFDGGTLIGRIILEPSVFANVGDEFAALVFFDKTAEFNVVCTGTFTNHLHTSVGLGWNYDINELYAPNLAHEFIGMLPENIKWTYAAAP